MIFLCTSTPSKADLFVLCGTGLLLLRIPHRLSTCCFIDYYRHFLKTSPVFPLRPAPRRVPFIFSGKSSLERQPPLSITPPALSFAGIRRLFTRVTFDRSDVSVKTP